MKLRLGRAPWTLRRRLVVSVVALFTLLSIVVGGVSVFVLYGNLSDPISAQLHRSANIAEQRASRGFAPTFDNGGGAGPTGLEPGSITAYSSGKTIVGNLSARMLGGSTQTLTQKQLRPIAEVTHSHLPQDIAIPGLGDFRVIRTNLMSYQDPSSGAVVKYYGYTAYPLSQTNSTLAQFAFALGGISLAGILLVAFATWFIVSYALRPLRRVAATATEVASLELDRGEVDLSVRVPEADTDTRTEVGQVGAAFNTMLGHVDNALQARQASESRVRQFVADASHELRTPLASIRGYAELTRRGHYDLPEDVTHSLGRVESEAVRMTSLVEDLLLLARLDAGRDIETAPVDLTSLLVDCLSDAHAAGPDHKWELDVPSEPVMIEADGQRIHQVFVNLLANARVHTPPGTRVRLELAELRPGFATVTVNDNGQGIPKSVQNDLFERFARGDSSRARTSGSTGLGLAIVKAVVDAHDGSVTVKSRKGSTTFTVDLPKAGPAVDESYPRSA
ncbi:MAG TPA: HAMP domain-containing sensor histidine kinase [Galbitalea sp.]|jgi:two-component system OmpR family sensor kinase|nr:HAMP domain-containing sensor histidine kinase [Galbitalea sp.]